MWHDSEDRLSKAVERFEEGAVEAARIMLRNLDRRGVISPRIDLYLGHCHLEAEEYRHGRLGHIERAIEAFRAALSRSPEIEEVHCNLTHCYALAGDLASAEEHARQAVGLDPHCPHVHRHLALAYLLAGQPERSLAAWRRVRVLKSDHPELPVGVGRAYADLGRRDEARRCFLEALSGPFSADASFGLGDLARAGAEQEEAAEHYSRALETDPEFEEAALRRAECLADLGRFEDALLVIAPLAEQDDRGEEVTVTTARILHGCGYRRRAVQALREMVEADPDEAGRWLVLGRHLHDVGRVRSAVSVLRRAVRLDPEDPEAPRYLARALARSGAGNRAVSVLARAAYRNPGEQELHLDVAAALIARGREAAAERALLRGLSWNPEAAQVWAATAELAFEDGRMPLARARLRSALRRDRRHPQALGLLVHWLQRMRRHRQAVNAGRAAARVLPAGDPAIREYGRALLSCGRSQEALLQLRRYVLAAAGDPAGYEALACALEATGDSGGAKTQLRLRELVTMS